MTDHTPMQLEKYYTCYIERKLHIPYNPASARLTRGPLMFNALTTQDNTINIDDGSGGSDVGM